MNKPVPGHYSYLMTANDFLPKNLGVRPWLWNQKALEHHRAKLKPMAQKIIELLINRSKGLYWDTPILCVRVASSLHGHEIEAKQNYKGREFNTCIGPQEDGHGHTCYYYYYVFTDES